MGNDRRARGSSGQPAGVIAELGHRCAVDRMGALQAPSLAGAGWFAVRTGGASNDLNGVVSDGAVPEDDVARLLAWLDGVPASWLTTRPDPALTDALLAAGARPERTGHWCDRALDDMEPSEQVERVDDPDDVLAVLDACGWYDGPSDLAVRRTLLQGALADDAWAHWCVRRDGDPVGALSAWRGTGLEVVDVAVLPSYRRQGVGAALVATAMAWGSEHGLSQAVAAPSPDGAALFRSLGFAFEPVTPDVCFYLPDR